MRIRRTLMTATHPKGYNFSTTGRQQNQAPLSSKQLPRQRTVTTRNSVRSTISSTLMPLTRFLHHQRKKNRHDLVNLVHVRWLLCHGPKHWHCSCCSRLRTHLESKPHAFKTTDHAESLRLKRQLPDNAVAINRRRGFQDHQPAVSRSPSVAG